MIFILSIVMLAFAVSAEASSYPVIEKISIYPSNPDKYDDLTCSVSVSDFDGDLDYVKFNWEVNGKLVRQNNRLVYGTSDTAEDILSSFYTNAGDYVVCKVWVYDFDDYYDYETHAVHVGEQNQNKPPSSSYVEITPRHPNPQQDLTCSVLATDADDNLDYVTFKWYVNLNEVRTGKKNLYGSSDTAIDLLPSSYTNAGDNVVCKVMVVDTLGASDTESSLPVYIEDDYPQPNRKPVAILTTDTTHAGTDEYVRFSGIDSYDTDGYVIQYYFDFGDGSHSPWLPGSSPYTYHAYSEEGVYYARLKVKDNNYLESEWSREIAIYVEDNGYYDRYPEVESVRIEPSYPDEYDDLTCEARVSDGDGDLDYVRFEWYVNGYLEESRTVNVYGHTDEAEDILEEDYFDDNDRVRCKVTVYDESGRSDSDYDTVTIGEDGYDENPEIRSIEIDPEYPEVFDDLTCKVRVEDDDGDLDYVRFQWFVEGEEIRDIKKDVYGRSDYVSLDLDTRYFDYKDWVKCKATVYDEEGNSDSEFAVARIGIYPYPDGECEHTIETFDYSAYVLEGTTAWVEVKIRNTGDRSANLNLKLFADNSQKDSYSVYLRAGREIEKRFELELPVGSHNIRLESKLDCASSTKNKYADIIIYKSGNGPIIPDDEEEEPPEITETSVFISPTKLDIEIYTGKTIEILIQSPEEQTFKIEVLDLPEDWVNYPKEVEVYGKERVYAYLVPKELGEYTFRVKVKVADQTFEETIELYVAPEGELSGDEFDGITGFMAAGGSWIVGLIVLVIIVAAVLIYYGYKRFKKKRYEEHVYGEREIPKTPEFRPYEPSSGMMKGSVGSVSKPEAEKHEDVERQIPSENRYSDLSYFPRYGKDFPDRQSKGEIFR